MKKRGFRVSVLWAALVVAPGWLFLESGCTSSSGPDPQVPGSASASASAKPAAASSAQFESLRKSEDCGSRKVLCLFVGPPHGVADDEHPILEPGESVTVKVLGPEGTAVSLEWRERRLSESLLERRATAAGQGASLDAQEERAYIALFSNSLQVSESAVSVEVNLSTSGKVVDSFELPINRGRYFVRPGVLFPVMFGGDSAIYSTTVPGSADRVVRSDREITFVPALTINVYPAGRSNGVINSFSEGFWALRWFALQAGAGLDFSKPTGFFGLGFEPVSGFTLSGGAGVRFGATRLDRGYEDGTLLLPNQPLPSHTGPLGFGYLGVTLSTELVDTLKAVKSSL